MEHMDIEAVSTFFLSKYDKVQKSKKTDFKVTMVICKEQITLHSSSWFCLICDVSDEEGEAVQNELSFDNLVHCGTVLKAVYCTVYWAVPVYPKDA